MFNSEISKGCFISLDAPTGIVFTVSNSKPANKIIKINSNE